MGLFAPAFFRVAVVDFATTDRKQLLLSRSLCQGADSASGSNGNSVKFILHSHFAEDVIQDHLGEPEGGYCFVLKAFRRVLTGLGSVEVVRHPETEVGPIFAKCRASGEPCFFLSFGPADETPRDLECPTVPVIAWEFTTIPDGAWGDDPRHDWRSVLSQFGHAIVLSGHAARVIGEAMGPDCKIGLVPPPIRARTEKTFPAEPGSKGLEIKSRATGIDTAQMELDVDLLAPAVPAREDDPRAAEPSWPRTTRNRPTLTPAAESLVRVNPGTILYTSVLNPNEPGKNPHDLVTAFCSAFREVDDATLILKVGDHGLQSFYGSLIPILYKLSPFKCRVLVLPGFLQDSAYDRLIRATTFCVNASAAEGVGLPLMEFMACGKPAIAPAHTAMSDYIESDAAFVLRGSRQITNWPHAPHGPFRTMSFRLDWESLRDAFSESYRLARTSPEQYREMSKRARNKMRECASAEITRDKLRSFFSSVAVATAQPSPSPVAPAETRPGTP